MTSVIEKQQLASFIKQDSRVDIRETSSLSKNKKQTIRKALLKYKKITIRQLIRFIFGIEHNIENARVSMLKIKKNYADGRYIDVEFDIISESERK